MCAAFTLSVPAQFMRELIGLSMPPRRNRHACSVLLKRLRASPVVAIQGARQTGNSYLARELLTSRLPKLEYRTFDRAVDQRFAAENPEVFLRTHADAKPLIIDEALKVPEIFESVKLLIDENRAPGRFLLLGSTEFSHRSGEGGGRASARRPWRFQGVDRWDRDSSLGGRRVEPGLEEKLRA